MTRIPQIRVAIVDDHPLFRAGVTQSLRNADIDVVAEGACSADAVHIVDNLAPDILIVDIRIAGDWIKIIETMSGRCPNLKVLILTGVADENAVMTFLRAGVAGYALKGISATELVESVRRVQAGERYVFPSLAAKLLLISSRATDPPQIVGLSPREEQILNCLRSGLSNKEIGRSLDLSEKTIKHYLSSLLTKLHVRNRVEAALFASTHHRNLDGRPGPRALT